MARRASYKFSDTNTQAAIITNSLRYGLEIRPAIKAMENRVNRFYGLNNKYNGKGNRR